MPAPAFVGLIVWILWTPPNVTRGWWSKRWRCCLCGAAVSELPCWARSCCVGLMVSSCVGVTKGKGAQSWLGINWARSVWCLRFHSAFHIICLNFSFGFVIYFVVPSVPCRKWNHRQMCWIFSPSWSPWLWLTGQCLRKGWKPLCLMSRLMPNMNVISSSGSKVIPSRGILTGTSHCFFSDNKSNSGVVYKLQFLIFDLTFTSCTIRFWQTSYFLSSILFQETTFKYGAWPNW